MASERALLALASLAFLSTAGLFAFAPEGIKMEDLRAIGAVTVGSLIVWTLLTSREEHTLRTA